MRERAMAPSAKKKVVVKKAASARKAAPKVSASQKSPAATETRVKEKAPRELDALGFFIRTYSRF